MICGYRHTGLVVRNLEKSLAFYEGVLGFCLWKRMVETGTYIETVVGIPGVVLEWAKLKAPDDSLIELLQYHSHPDPTADCKLQPSNKLGCSHLAFTINHIEELYHVLLEKGILCKSEPQTAPDGTAKVLYCHDPDGIILELVEDCQSARL
ncbi:MAG TPA: glyoxalase [Firmicutes bacterium]|jgi:catechol 2,3-dioxygenase-like lactoylglutathione lyase family enzyme|nr:glyoxalase [Bacillota bacterium]